MIGPPRPIMAEPDDAMQLGNQVAAAHYIVSGPKPDPDRALLMEVFDRLISLVPWLVVLVVGLYLVYRLTS